MVNLKSTYKILEIMDLKRLKRIKKQKFKKMGPLFHVSVWLDLHLEQKLGTSRQNIIRRSKVYANITTTRCNGDSD